MNLIRLVCYDMVLTFNELTVQSIASHCALQTKNANDQWPYFNHFDFFLLSCCQPYLYRTRYLKYSNGSHQVTATEI